MSLVISDDLVKASGFSENELFLEIVVMLFQQDKISNQLYADVLNAADE